jgi:hypothetical protein
MPKAGKWRASRCGPRRRSFASRRRQRPLTRMRRHAAAVDPRWLAPAAAVVGQVADSASGLTPPPAGIRANDWNLLSVTMDANIIRPILNQSYDFIPGATDERDEHGPIALYVGRAAEVHFKDVALKDLYAREINPKRPGGAEFVPELIHNKSGVGSQLLATDLNKDCRVDIVTSTNRGTFIFWGQR